MANGEYQAGVKRLLDTVGPHDLRMLLLDNAGSYVFDPDHTNLTALSLGSNEISTTNYARQDLGGVATTIDTTNNRVRHTSNAGVFASLGPTSAGPTVKQVVIYIHVDGTAANDVPLYYIDDGGLPKTVNGEDFNVTPSADGWAYYG